MSPSHSPSWQPPNSEFPPPRHGEPSLHRAARVGDLGAIRACVAQGDDLEAPFDLQLDPSALPRLATPLMVAAGSGDGADVATVRLLLDLGANATTLLNGASALDFACQGLGWNYRPGGDLLRMQALWEAGCRLPTNLKSVGRLVADAAAQGDVPRLKQLIDWGAPVNPIRAAELPSAVPKDPPGAADTESEWSAEFESDESASEQFADLDEVWNGAPKLLDAPFSFEIPLFQAVGADCLECVRVLLAAGARVDVRDRQGETALFGVVSPEVARALIGAGLSTEEVNIYGWTALTAGVGDPDQVRSLLAVGADANYRFDQGYSVFLSAVGSNRNLEALELLVAGGADPHVVSDLGYNAFHAAVDVNFEANAEESVRGTMLFLRRLGVDLELRNNRGQTPLARAIQEGTAIEVRILCELGANVNATARPPADDNSPGGPPLLFVAIDSAVDADLKTASLLAAGARLETCDAAGRSPRQAAQARLLEIRNWERNEYTDDWIRQAEQVLALFPPEQADPENDR